jgi:hypothetical protein
MRIRFERFQTAVHLLSHIDVLFSKRNGFYF